MHAKIKWMIELAFVYFIVSLASPTHVSHSCPAPPLCDCDSVSMCTFVVLVPKVNTCMRLLYVTFICLSWWLVTVPVRPMQVCSMWSRGKIAMYEIKRRRKRFGSSAPSPQDGIQDLVAVACSFLSSRLFRDILTVTCLLLCGTSCCFLRSSGEFCDSSRSIMRILHTGPHLHNNLLT